MVSTRCEFNPNSERGEVQGVNGEVPSAEVTRQAFSKIFNFYPDIKQIISTLSPVMIRWRNDVMNCMVEGKRERGRPRRKV